MSQPYVDRVRSPLSRYRNADSGIDRRRDRAARRRADNTFGGMRRGQSRIVIIGGACTETNDRDESGSCSLRRNEGCQQRVQHQRIGCGDRNGAAARRRVTHRSILWLPAPDVHPARKNGPPRKSAP